jgi:hypothetical protein
MSRSAFLDLLAVLAACAVVTVGLFYALVTGNYDWTTLLVSVILPVGLGSAIISTRKKLILLFAFLAYIWAVIDDAPIFFDSVLTWPEVTQFHPFLPRLFMNIVIHALTAVFMYLTIRQSIAGRHIGRWDAFKVVILTLVAFGLAYAQNIPIDAIQNLVLTSWYQFDITEKVASIFFFYLAIREAKIRSTRQHQG